LEPKEYSRIKINDKEYAPDAIEIPVFMAGISF
jgi:hypothetical protein